MGFVGDQAIKALNHFSLQIFKPIKDRYDRLTKNTTILHIGLIDEK